MIKLLIDFLMPPRCIYCNNVIEYDDALCGECWSELSFIDEPLCTKCGKPFDIEIESECLQCIKEPPFYDLARSLVRFDPKSKVIIHRYKYYDKTYLAKFFAKALYNKFGPLIHESDAIACVPMHKIKRIFRMYNHAQILAEELGLLSGKQFSCDYLKKIRNTKSQALLSKSARKTNLKGSFGVNAGLVKGKKFIFIDDVIPFLVPN